MGKMIVRTMSLWFFSVFAVISHIVKIYPLVYIGIFMLGFTVSTIIFSELERLEWFCLSKGIDTNNIRGKKDVSKTESERVAKNGRKTK